MFLVKPFDLINTIGYGLDGSTLNIRHTGMEKLWLGRPMNTHSYYYGTQALDRE